MNFLLKKQKKAFYQSEIRGTLIISFNTKNIGSSASFKCINSDTVIFEEGLTQIGAFAFAELKRNCPLTIPSSVATTGKNAFENCNCLKELIIKGDSLTIRSNEFHNCKIECDLIIQQRVNCQSELMNFLDSLSKVH